MTLAEAVEIVREELMNGEIAHLDRGGFREATELLASHAERTLKSQTKQRERTKMLLELGRAAEKSTDPEGVKEGTHTNSY